MKNRICMPAMHLHYVDQGYATDQLIEFYRLRSLGGVGMIIVGGCVIDDVAGGLSFIGLNDDKFIPGLERIAQAIHQGGALAMTQLYHAGKYAWSPQIGGRQAVSASRKRSKLTGEMPIELDQDGIQAVQKSFADAALRAQRSGFDGAEILGSAGYLICQFLSATTNSRNDSYGGSLENRMRFGIEVVQKIKQTTSDDFLVTMRIAGNDFIKGGNTNQEWQQIAQAFEKAGVQAFNVTGGWHETKVPQITMGVPPGAYIYLAAGIKKVVGVPVMASNRLNDPQLAEDILREGLADIINMGRPLIADPDLPIKVAKGQLAMLNQCIACNQGCFDAVFSDRPVECLVNPLVSREHEMELKVAEQSKKVLVVGGGVGGMKAAITCAQRGHQVTLFEKERLGGQMDLVSASPDRHEFATLEKNLINNLRQVGVSIRYEQANAQIIGQMEVDAIIIATGGREIRPSIPGLDGNNVFSAWQVLRKQAKLGQKIAIIGGGAVGCETALLLAHIGTLDGATTRFLIENEAEELETIRQLVIHGPKEVTIIEMLDKMGKDIGITTRWTIMQDLKRHKIQTINEATVAEIKNNGLLYRKDNKEVFIEADTIVYAVGTQADSALYQEICHQGIKTFLIGDAKNPRKAMDAIHEGFAAAMQI